LNIPLWCNEKEKENAENGDATSGYSFEKHVVTAFQKRFWAGGSFPLQKPSKKVMKWMALKWWKHPVTQLDTYRFLENTMVS
jgi:hypothetical protein